MNKKKLLIIGGIVLFLVVLGSIVSEPQSTRQASRSQETRPAPVETAKPEKPTPTPTPAEVPIKISAIKLSEEYNENQVAADQKYKNKLVEISGVIQSIGTDIGGTPYIVLKGREFSLFGVQCMFDKSQIDKLAALNKEQSITIICRVSGEIVGNIILRNCHF